ncbi:hypothetical protein [Deinococcus hopiensis]|uniref:hypothetical protein n=1 Tax=Deinococcus hopiensis TaxID=309885 RepID=UPI001BAFF9AD|nr:hypothetical protein [Deinococcus hopiensis]
MSRSKTVTCRLTYTVTKTETMGVHICTSDIFAYLPNRSFLRPKKASNGVDTVQVGCTPYVPGLRNVPLGLTIEFEEPSPFRSFRALLIAGHRLIDTGLNRRRVVG